MFMQLNSQAFKAEMEAKFGSDEALGVWFELEEDGRALSAAAYDQLSLKRGNPADAASKLPHGGSGTCCTDYAVHIYLALKDRVQIFGFSNKDNPTSRVAREQIHPCGHDYALVDGRYIVDPWPRLVPAAFFDMVFDLEDEADGALALDVYGPQRCWTHMTETEQYARVLSGAAS
jgi:hypothetical protein